MPLYISAVIALTCSFCVAIIHAQQWSTVIYESGKYTLQSGLDTTGVVWGFFSDDISVNGWGKLYIQSNGTYAANVQMYAGGYLEGVLTRTRITNYHTNFMANQFGGSPPPAKLLQFVMDNFAWTLKMATSSQEGDNYWWHVARVLDQFEGLLSGYNDGNSLQMTLTDLLLINLSGDLDDLQSVFPATQEDEALLSRWDAWSFAELENRLAKVGRCSVLVKVTETLLDLMFAHTTWGNYWTMQRIWKTYNFDLPNSNSTGMSFSGYPGILISFDDYFILKDTNLVASETTNTVLNMSLYDNNINVQSVMYWIRAFVASRKASTAKDWVDLFSQFNSGTYNNQWIVVDYKLFSPGKAIVNNTLWVMEQMPGAVYTEDVSSILQYGYWPSYNRPYFSQVYSAMGYTYFASKYGDMYSYELNPRANIFRRDQGQVATFGDMMQIMQSNNYATDPLSSGYPGNAISARFDLKGGPSAPVDWFQQGPHGGIDSKITNAAMVGSSRAMIISGPTHQNASECPPFDWSAWPNIQHVGLPEVYNFTWIAA